MDNFIRLLNNQYQTPQKTYKSDHKSYNQSRGFSSSKRHRNPIFKQNSFSSTARKTNTFDRSFKQKPNYHIQFQQVLSDDFCGCENTLYPCRRISDSYLKDISMSQLKLQYAKVGNIETKISNQRKRHLLATLPRYYPELYYTHLNNLLSNLQANQITNQSFLCLAWIQFHCKLQYITFFFFNDIRKILTSGNNFIDDLQHYMIKQNIQLGEQIQYYRKIDLPLKQFILQLYQSIGTNIIPLSQFGKFLQIVRSRGLKAVMQLISLFIVKKRSQLYQVLKLWNLHETTSLRIYLRELNWDVFFQQIQIMH